MSRYVIRPSTLTESVMSAFLWISFQPKGMHQGVDLCSFLIPHSRISKQEIWVTWPEGTAAKETTNTASCSSSSSLCHSGQNALMRCVERIEMNQEVRVNGGASKIFLPNEKAWRLNGMDWWFTQDEWHNQEAPTGAGMHSWLTQNEWNN